MSNNLDFQLWRRSQIQSLDVHPAIEEIEELLNLRVSSDSSKVAAELILIIEKHNLEGLTYCLRSDPNVLLNVSSDNIWGFGLLTPCKERILEHATAECAKQKMDQTQYCNCEVFFRTNIEVSNQKRWWFGRVSSCGTTVQTTRRDFSDHHIPMSLVLEIRKTGDYDFQTAVYHREVLRLQMAERGGQLTDLPTPSLPHSDADFICSPSTFRLYVIFVESCDADGGGCEIEKLCAGGETKAKRIRRVTGELQHILNSKMTTESEKEAKGTLVRCNVSYMCGHCRRTFEANCEWLERVDGKFVDPLTLQTPTKTCKVCLISCSPTSGTRNRGESLPIEEFSALKHAAWREHSPDSCTLCMEGGTWCKEAQKKFRTKPKIFDKNLRTLQSKGDLKGVTRWHHTKDGVVMKAVRYQGLLFDILVTPATFVLVRKKRDLVREKHAGDLRLNHAPRTLETFRDVLTALNFVNQITGRKRERGAFANKIIELFLENEGELDTEIVDGFKRFSLPSADLASTRDWLTSYHGSNLVSCASIFLGGMLKRPREGGHDVRHGQCGSTSGDSIYTSPSKEYAAFPTYAELFDLKREVVDAGGEKRTVHRFGQIIFEVKVRPNSYKILPNTLGGHWPSDLRLDPRFESHQDMEWLNGSSDDLRLTAILVRQFGHKAGGFGHKAGGSNELVRADCGDRMGRTGAEYHWSQLRQDDYRKKHLIVKPHGGAGSCAYVRVPGDSRVIASVVAPRFTRHAKTAEEAAELLARENPKFHKECCAKYPIVSTPKTVERVARAVPGAPALVLDVFLCVEKHLAATVQAHGFTARIRSNVAVSKSIEEAIRGYKRHHNDAHAVFRVLLSPTLQAFSDSIGSMRINGKYIPSQNLEIVPG